jgi:death-on-curing family protein
MTKVKFPPPNTWLSIRDCELAYATLAKLLNRRPLPAFSKRYQGRLEAILGAVQQEFAGELLYPTLVEAAAAYFVMVIKGHPFGDGNKRSAVLFTDIFITFNGWSLTLDFAEMYSLALLVAEEHQMSHDELKEGVSEIFAKNIESKNRPPLYEVIRKRGQLFLERVTLPSLPTLTPKSKQK